LSAGKINVATAHAGVRMFIDHEQPVARRYVLCVANGCMADFDVTADFDRQAKKRQQLVLQGHQPARAELRSLSS
jgi:invasion protein IalB